MKSSKSFLALLLILFSGSVMATGNLRLNILTGVNDRAMVSVTNATESLFEIQILDQSGDLLYYKSTHKPSKQYADIFDFSTLNDGQYTMTVSLGKETEIANLEKRAGKLFVVDQRKELEPFFALKEKQLDITFLNYDKEDVTLYVYDNRTNELIHQEDLKNGFSINHAIDFSRLGRGDYDAVIATDSQYYTYEVNID
jgi:hypothetical protein